MRSVGVRELKQRTSQVLRRVQDSGEEIEVAHHGRVIARFVPVERTPAQRRTAAAWSTLDQVAREIGAVGWRSSIVTTSQNRPPACTR